MPGKSCTILSLIYVGAAFEHEKFDCATGRGDFFFTRFSDPFPDVTGHIMNFPVITWK